MSEKFPNITAEGGDNLFDKDALETEKRALEIADRINELKDKNELGEDEQKELLGLIGKIEKMYSPDRGFESIPNLEEQYESQKKILLETGILTKLSGEPFMVDITDEMRDFPTYEEILERLESQREIIEQKAEQGFTKLLIVPFGMKLDNLIEKYKEVLLKHNKDGKLFATKENPTDKDEKLELDAKNPMYVWDQYKNADTSGTLVYHPKEFSKNHQGKTKEEVVKQNGPWAIRLVEENPNIPREGKGKTEGGRKQLETNKSPNEYLATIGKGQYSNEAGLTPEDWLTQAITHLEETNEVIDDYRGKGTISYLTGSFFPASGFVPDACWVRGFRRAGLGWDVPEGRVGYVGARSAVRV